MIDREYELAFASEERWIERDKARIIHRDVKPENVWRTPLLATILRRGVRR